MPGRGASRRATAARGRNLVKAQISRIGIREPRSPGRMLRKKLRGSTIRRR